MDTLLWHFAGTRLRDGSPLPEAGHMSTWIEDIEPCVTGWHASERALDALQYAPGPYVARVRLHGATIPHPAGYGPDKLVGQQRETVSDYVDATADLRLFACACALDVIDSWASPDIVRRYLESRSEAIRIDAASAAITALFHMHSSSAEAAAEAAVEAAARDVITAAWAASQEAAFAASDLSSVVMARQNARLEDLLTRCIDAKGDKR